MAMAMAIAPPFFALLPSPLRLPASAARLSPSLSTFHKSLPISCSSGGSCCGGSGNSGGGSSSCSSHQKPPSLANLGKEFEHLVATSTLLEFEKNYNSKPMEGTISRDIIENVMETVPEASASESGEKFLDIDSILQEANGVSQGTFVFSDESDDFVLV